MAWHPLGWTPAFFAEIEKFPSAVLAHHYGSNMPGEPDASNGVPNHGDMTQFEEWPHHAIDLLVGGTPCQDFSVAGLRAGLDGARGSLMLTYGAIARRYRPRWLAWENVPGVLSDDGGRGFASLLGLLSGQRVEVPATGWRNAGVVEGYKGAYGLAWRVLDAQFVRVDGFGRAVPQRRRRVFVIGYLGDWRRAAAVLFEPESLRGDPPPRRESKKDVAPTISARTKGGGGLGTDFDLDGGLIPSSYAIQAGAMRENPESGPDGVGVQSDIAYTLEARSEVQAMAFDLRGREGGAMPEGPHLTANIHAASGGSSRSYIAQAFGGNKLSGPIDVATAVNAHGGPVGRLDFETETFITEPVAFNGRMDPVSGPVPGALDTDPLTQCVQYGWAVRRPTPRECERLQGFPDGFTDVLYRGKPAADGPRYKALGNSMAVNVMRWLGTRIQAVDVLQTNEVGR